MNKKDLSPRVARWWTFLQDLEFEIVYKKGRHISHVDFLSRNSVKSQKPVNLYKNMSKVVNLVEGQSWLEMAQKNYPDVQNLISHVLSGELDENQYIFKDGLLFYEIQPDKPKLYIPKGFRFSLLKLYHDENSHVGRDKTLKKIREHFWFPIHRKFIRR
ncbi:unnamed protein product [Euphydryas editha]|uniref:RNA-directed DNA polymerase n=1 Tax=Euphydryas editha TaxID=104508 RepID=A0AAU9TNX3_EUPED|nr:unnamed protein product [Euphydryas editha]